MHAVSKERWVARNVLVYFVSAISKFSDFFQCNCASTEIVGLLETNSEFGALHNDYIMMKSVN